MYVQIYFASNAYQIQIHQEQNVELRFPSQGRAISLWLIVYPTDVQTRTLNTWVLLECQTDQAQNPADKVILIHEQMC